MADRGLTAMFRAIMGWGDAKAAQIATMMEAIEEERRRNKRAVNKLLGELTSHDAVGDKDHGD